MRFIARHGGTEETVEVERAGTGYRVRIGERWIVADLVDAGPFFRSLRMEDGTQYLLVHHREGNTHEITFADATLQVEILDPLSSRRTKREDETAAGGVVRAPMPGRIVRLLVEAGTAVKKGAGLLVLEAMKMENEIQSPIDGTISEIHVAAGQTVENGAELVHVS